MGQGKDMEKVRFSIVQGRLESHGWTLDRIRGSHHVFTKPNELPISIPVHGGKVKPYYARKVNKICEEEEDEDQSDSRDEDQETS